MSGNLLPVVENTATLPSPKTYIPDAASTAASLPTFMVVWKRDPRADEDRAGSQFQKIAMVMFVHYPQPLCSLTDLFRISPIPQSSPVATPSGIRDIQAPVRDRALQVLSCAILANTSGATPFPLPLGRHWRR